MRLIDRTSQALGRDIARTRQQSAIRRIGIHHSATASGTTAIFENFWQTIPHVMGGVGGYHEVILLNGDVEINYLPTRISHGAAGQNDDTYHICVVGNFTQTQLEGIQLQVLLDRIRFNVDRFANVTFNRVLGHRELPGQSTLCPAVNMNHIRDQAGQSNNMYTVARATGGFYTAADARAGRNQRTIVQPGNYHVFNRSQGMINVTTRQGSPGSWINPTATSAPTQNDMHTVARATGGFYTAADARAGRNQRTIVQPGNYYVFNRSQGMINVTTRQGVPGNWINPTASASQPSNNIRVGSRVRLRSAATHWATGERIDQSAVRTSNGHRRFDVIQMRNNNREALLSGVISWANTSDLRLV